MYFALARYCWESLPKNLKNCLDALLVSQSPDKGMISFGVTDMRLWIGGLFQWQHCQDSLDPWSIHYDPCYVSKLRRSYPSNEPWVAADDDHLGPHNHSELVSQLESCLDQSVSDLHYIGHATQQLLFLISYCVH